MVYPVTHMYSQIDKALEMFGTPKGATSWGLCSTGRAKRYVRQNYLKSKSPANGGPSSCVDLVGSSSSSLVAGGV